MNNKKAVFSTLFCIFIAALFILGCNNHLLKPQQDEPHLLVRIENSTGARNATTTGEWQISAWIENRDGTKSHQQNVTSASGSEASITFDDLVIGSQIKIHLEVTKIDDTQTKFTGESGWTTIKEGVNVIVIVLREISSTGEDESDSPASGENQAPDPSTPAEPPAIVNAETPVITQQPHGKSQTFEPNTATSVTTPLEIAATIGDGGTLTYQWYSNTSNSTSGGTLINGATNKTYTASTEAKTTTYFYCVVTNTNNAVNGTKTASATSNIATVASIEGELSSITAQYVDGAYQLVNSEINYSNIKIEQTYTAGSETQVVTVSAEEVKDQYTIELQYNNAIGNIPATVIHTETKKQTTVTIPVKYQLDAVYLSGAVDSTIAQYTGSHSLSASYNDPSVSLKLYQNNTFSELTDYVNYTWNPSTVDNTKTTSYTLTVSSKNEWCILPSEGITKEVTVSVTPWTLEINADSPENLAGGQGYTLTATNTSGTATGITYESDGTSFSISGTTLTTPAATTSPQSATIAAKYNGQTLATLVVKVPAPSYDPAVGLSWADSTLTIYNETGLINFRKIVNGDVSTSAPITVGDKTFSGQDRTVNARLATDIKLTEDWTPIANNSTYPYAGTFDGAGHTVSGINVTGGGNPKGFFGSIGTNKAIIKNLTVEGTVDVSYYAGGIAGYVDGGTIEYCVNKINVTSTTTTGTGGIAGYIAGSGATITGCVNFGEIKSYGYVGGIVGGNYYSNSTGAKIDKCINLGTITAENGSSLNAGGIYGYAALTSDAITNCANFGNIVSSGSGAGITNNDDENNSVKYSLNVGDMSGVTSSNKRYAVASNTSGSYTGNYYDSSKITGATTTGGTGKATSDLKVASAWDTSWTTENWSFAAGRYPVPNIQDNIPPTIWNNIVTKASE